MPARFLPRPPAAWPPGLRQTSFAWHDLRDQLLRSSSTLKFQRDFEAMRRDRVPLAGFIDPAALLDRLHHGPADPDGKNRILAALVEAAQEDGAASDGALTLMLLALWPGLDAVRHRAIRRGVGTPEDVTSDILARATEAIRSLNLQRVSRIAATILQNVERDLIRARRREVAGWANLCTTHPDDITDSNDRSSTWPTEGLMHRDLHRLLGLDAQIVLRVAVDGYFQSEVADEFGLSAPATAKRYQRATRRLREAHEEFF